MQTRNDSSLPFPPVAGRVGPFRVITDESSLDSRAIPNQWDTALRILIVRLSAIGDVVQTMPMACALRERFPEAFLTWVVDERAAALLRGHEALDELITLPRHWLKSFRSVWNLRRQLRAMNFDVALEVQGLTKSAIICWLSGARRRIGFGGRLGRELSPWLNSETVNPTGHHVVDQNISLLQPLGIESPKVRFQAPEHAADALGVERMIAKANLQAGFGLINVGAGWPSKLWPTDRFAAVARHLGIRHGLPTMVLWAEDEELALAEETVASANGHAQLAPPTSLTELAALSRRAEIFIGSDSGPLHIAAAVDTRCVGLYGPWPAMRHAPYGEHSIALQEKFFEGTTRERRTASSEYMEAISSDLVCEACDEILSHRASVTRRSFRIAA